MKKRIMFCLILCMMIGSIAGCQKADNETDNTSINMQETEETVIADADIQETEDVEIEENADEESEDEKEEISNDTFENNEEVIYNLEDYGTVERKRQEYFAEGTETVAFYYEMENFFFHETVLNAPLINRTLQKIYEGYEETYIEEAAEYKYGADEYPNVPYTSWYILCLEYVGEDYISILYNDISYMGGAHPYSYFDGITIDCRTGEQVTASQLLRKSDEEILTEVSNEMGFDITAAWDEIDFYLTDSSIVFFYRMSPVQEEVVLRREF